MTKTIAKLLVCISLISVFLAMLHFPAEAYGTTQKFVYDEAGLLTPAEEAELQQYAEEYASKEISVVFVTTNSTIGKSTATYASNFYDSLDLYDNGVLFLIDMYHREVYIDTVGRYIDIFTSSRIEKTLDKGFEYIYSDYFMVFKSMFEHSRQYLNQTSGGFNIKIDEMLLFNSIVLTIIVAAVLVTIHNKHNKPLKVKNYFKSNGGFVVNDRDDQYFNTKVNVLHGYYSSSSRGGGGGSRGGGGRSHGGGGRRF